MNKEPRQRPFSKFIHELKEHLEALARPCSDPSSVASGKLFSNRGKSFPLFPTSEEVATFGLGLQLCRLC
jgi:hypothetical protein